VKYVNKETDCYSGITKNDHVLRETVGPWHFECDHQSDIEEYPFVNFEGIHEPRLPTAASSGVARGGPEGPRPPPEH